MMSIYTRKNSSKDERYVIILVEEDSVFQTVDYGDVLVTQGNYAVMDGETGEVFLHGLAADDLSFHWQESDDVREYAPSENTTMVEADVDGELVDNRPEPELS